RQGRGARKASFGYGRERRHGKPEPFALTVSCPKPAFRSATSQETGCLMSRAYTAKCGKSKSPGALSRDLAGLLAEACEDFLPPRQAPVVDWIVVPVMPADIRSTQFGDRPVDRAGGAVRRQRIIGQPNFIVHPDQRPEDREVLVEMFLMTDEEDAFPF